MFVRSKKDYFDRVTLIHFRGLSRVRLFFDQKNWSAMKLLKLLCSQLPLLLLLLIFIESKLGKWIDLFHAHATIYRIVNKKRFNFKKSKNFWITKIFKLATFFCVMIKFIFLFWCSKKIIFAIFWCVTLFVQPEKDEWWECPRPKKNCWLDRLYLWMARDAEKKVNCILGSRQTDDNLKTLFALDPGETKQRLMRLWSVLQVVFLKQ